MEIQLILLLSTATFSGASSLKFPTRIYFELTHYPLIHVFIQKYQLKTYSVPGAILILEIGLEKESKLCFLRNDILVWGGQKENDQKQINKLINNTIPNTEGFNE